MPSCELVKLTLSGVRSKSTSIWLNLALNSPPKDMNVLVKSCPTTHLSGGIV